MIADNQTQITNSLLNLQQCYNTLNELKFKGKKILEEVANALYERELIIKSIRSSAPEIENNIFEHAINNCNEWIGQQTAKFQISIIEPYTLACEKIALNRHYLRSLISVEDQSTQITEGNLQFLLTEMIQLANLMGDAYTKQLALIAKLWSAIAPQLLQTGKQPQNLKQLLLHISFQTEIDSEISDCWKTKLFALSNQRYNAKKK